MGFQRDTCIFYDIALQSKWSPPSRNGHHGICLFRSPPSYAIPLLNLLQIPKFLFAGNSFHLFFCWIFVSLMELLGLTSLRFDHPFLLLLVTTSFHYLIKIYWKEEGGMGWRNPELPHKTIKYMSAFMCIKWFVQSHTVNKWWSGALTSGGMASTSEQLLCNRIYRIWWLPHVQLLEKYLTYSRNSVIFTIIILRCDYLVGLRKYHIVPISLHFPCMFSAALLTFSHTDRELWFFKDIPQCIIQITEAILKGYLVKG